MHELSITKKIIEIIEKESKTRNIIPKTVHLELGQLSSYKKEPIIFYFDCMKSGLIKDTEMVIIELCGKVKCNSCQKVTKIKELEMFCPECSSTNIEIVQGRDIKIKEMRTDV